MKSAQTLIRIGVVYSSIQDTVLFGEYEQDNITSNGKEPIEWIIFSKDDTEAFLLSKYALDLKQFNDEKGSVFWEKSKTNKDQVV